MFNEEAVRAALQSTTLRGEIHVLRSTTSTNGDARRAALRGAPHGSIWIAEEQTAGRGRGDHLWQSDAGLGLYLSLLIRPKLTAQDLQWLPLITGLAAAEAIESETGVAIDIRWPNDLLIGALKTGGILVESKLAGAQVDFAIIGIGINLFHQHFSPGLGATSLSLEMRGKSQPDAQSLAIALLTRLGGELEQLCGTTARDAFIQRLYQRSSWLRGRRVTVHGPQACSGTTAGVDERGMLLVDAAGGLRTITTGGIRDAG